MPKRKRSPSPSSSRAIIIRQSPAPSPIIMGRRSIPSRRGGRSGLFQRAAGSARSLLPVKETIQGGGGGILAGLIDDVLPAALVTGKNTRAVAVFGIGAVLSWAIGLPPLVVAGLAGGVSRKMYDDFTGA